MNVKTVLGPTTLAAEVMGRTNVTRTLSSKRTILLAIVLGMALARLDAAPSAELRVTTFEKPWQIQTVSVGETSDSSAATVKLDIGKADQTVIGFGTCMSELSHEALCLLSEADRAKVLDEMFSLGGGDASSAHRSARATSQRTSIPTARRPCCDVEV